MHLIGNPIGTIASLLFTVQRCQSRVHTLRSHILTIQHDLSTTNNPNLAWRVTRNRSKLWKVFGLVCISYDEWKVKSMGFLTASLTRILNNPNAAQSQAALQHFENAAFLLAADRSTFVLPIFIVQAAFVFSLGAAFWRIIGVPPQPQSWTNIEAYSIAMSAPFLAILPAVFLSAMVGVAQTESSVPRILNGLREKLISEDWPERVGGIFLPESTMGKDLRGDGGRFAGVEQEETELTLSERIVHGGIYAWRPEMLALESLSHTWPLIVVASSFVLLSVFVAGWIAYRVPPEGFDCRNTAQMALLAVWALALGLDLLISVAMERYGYLKTGGGCWYEVMFVKEMVMALAAVTSIMVIQFGIFNRCDCYTLWGRAPLGLPQIPEVAADLMDRIALEWPLVVFLWVLVEVVMCLVIWLWWYNDAFRVYTQKDDGTSNLDWVPGWVSSAYRSTFKKDLDDGRFTQTIHGVEPEGSGPDMPLLDARRSSGDAKSKSPAPASRSSGRKEDVFGQVGPPAGEWASAATTELMNLRRRGT